MVYLNSYYDKQKPKDSNKYISGCKTSASKDEKDLVEIEKRTKNLKTLTLIKIEIIFNFIEYLIFVNLFFQIKAEHLITLNLTGRPTTSPNYEKIINCSIIPEPSKIYEEESLADSSNYKYEDNYLKYKCLKNSCNITLFWSNTILYAQSEEVILSEVINNVISTTNNELISNANYMFSGCEKILEIDFTQFRSDEIVTMSHMFDGCTSLIKIKGLSTKNVRNFSYLFNHCISLKDLDNISMITTQNDLQIDTKYMFADCQNLETIDLNKFKVKNIVDMNSIFSRA